MKTNRNYKVTAVIPARLASVRLPEKMLADVCGMPLIALTAKRVVQSNAFDEVIIATDSQKIVDAVGTHGYKAVLTDPSLPSGTARVAQIALENQSDIFVNVQGDEPMVDIEGLKKISDCFNDKKIEMATLWFELLPEDEKNPNVVKLVTDINSDAMYFSRSLIPYPRNYELFAPKKHIGVYGYRRETLLRLIEMKQTEIEKIESLEQLKALYYGIKIRAIKAQGDSTGVDTHADLEKVRSLVTNML